MKETATPAIHTTSQAPRRRLSVPLSFLSLAVTALFPAAVLAETYTVTQINPPAGASASSVTGLNAAGQVVGNTTVKSGRSTVAGRPFVWANGAAQSLPSYGAGTSAGVNAVSDSGVIVGNAPAADAAWWQPTGTGGYAVGSWNSLLPAGSTLHLVSAVSISRDGQFVLFDQLDSISGRDQAAVGRVTYSGGTPAAFSGLWLIDSLDGSVSSDGFVSAGMEIVHDGNGVVRVSGYAQHQSATARAFLWRNDVVAGVITLTDLDPTQTNFSSGDGVNNNGEVAGNGSQAYFWTSGGSRQQLPTLGGARSYANALNGAASLVGWSQRSGKNATNHAFIWSSGTGIRDLNALKSPTDVSGIELTNALRITDSGLILARGVKSGTAVNALLRSNP